MSIEEIRHAPVALACLVEPGTVEVYQLVAQYGPVGAVEALVAGQVPERLAAAVQARLAGTDPARLTEQALARTDRLGARVVIP
ncbi:MAG: DNA processing protein DprA, partial [Actinobacteria bacterium]